VSTALRNARRLLSDLDRCEHGRHQQDPCWGCPDGNPGNEIKVVGHGLGGDDITVDDLTVVLSALIEENAQLTAQVADLARRL
jgi:hypothetical protein